MSNEELNQRGYLSSGKLKGDSFGDFEDINIGNTTLLALTKVGLKATLPDNIKYPFSSYKPPRKPSNAKPDRVFAKRETNLLIPVAVAEYKSPRSFRGEKKLQRTAEQALFSAIALNVPIAIATDGQREHYLNVKKSITQKKLVFFNETRPLSFGVLQDLLSGGAIIRDPGELSERVWQIIWHATKDEPKECLLTFVEIFLLKFLSDNLPSATLPRSLSFDELVVDSQEFAKRHGILQIEYYVQKIRPKIKEIFQDNILCDDKVILKIFGLGTIVSKTSILNGFSFLRSSKDSAASFNKAFKEILNEFKEFGSLSSINPEFKLRLYETFLKKSARQSKLGQFFTPRNIVKAIVKMACLDCLQDGSVVLDPAAGVGGFVLEPTIMGVLPKDFISFEGGRVNQKIKLIGIDVDANTHILAKANTLIHFAEIIRDPKVSIEAINKLMAQMFILMNGNQTLGALEHPPTNSVDVILTNPPYVTQGSKIYKETINELTGTRNDLLLSDYYHGCGLGLESLYLRYISGALKPGGRAFVIVPQGLLTRTETGTKSMVLAECNLLASIALPRNSFFNTPQKTYILALEKRYTEADSRPNIFCSIVRSIGETLDYRRHPTPESNEMNEVSTAFVDWSSKSTTPNLDNIKIVSPEHFTKVDRWDVYRFWSDEELVKLGEREESIDRSTFIDEVGSQLSEIVGELNLAKDELGKLTTFDGEAISIGDENYFSVRRGKRVRRKDCDLNPGSIPVYSGSKDPNRPLGHVSENWLNSQSIPIETDPIITVNANGYVGAVFVRDERCVIHDDVMIIEVKRVDIDLEYLAYQLQESIASGNFEYEAKLYNRVKELSVIMPLGSADVFDIKLQQDISSAIKKFNTIRQKLNEVGVWSSTVRFKS